MKYTVENVTQEWRDMYDMGLGLGLEPVDAVSFADTRAPFYRQEAEQPKSGPVLRLVDKSDEEG